MAHDLKEMLRRYIKTLDHSGGRDVTAVRELSSSDCVWHYSGYPPMSQDEVIGFYGSFWKVFPDLNHEFLDLWQEGDCMASRLLLTGTQAIEFNGIQPSGKRIEFEVHTYTHTKNRKIVEHWGMFDNLGLQNALKGE